MAGIYEETMDNSGEVRRDRRRDLSAVSLDSDGNISDVYDRRVRKKTGGGADGAGGGIGGPVGGKR